MKSLNPKVTVAQFPDHSKLNPILDIYREMLLKHGVTVLRHSMYPSIISDPSLSTRWLYQNRQNVQILHFHYYQRLYQTDPLERSYRTPAKFMGFIAKILLAHKLGYHITWTAHNLYPHERIYPLLDVWARRLITSLADVVFVDSFQAKKIVQQTFPWIQNFVEAPHGHLKNIYPPGKSKYFVRDELSIPQNAFVFLTFGLIRGYKGIETLIEQFVHNLAGPSCYLVVAGDPHTPNTRQRLEALIKLSPYVIPVLQSIPNQSVAALFNACDVAVFPFSDIFTSSTVILACSLERAVVIPQTGAMPIREGQGAFIYDPKKNDLIRAMADSMQVDWINEGKKASQHILARDWNVTAQRMADEFKRLVKN